MNTKKFIAATSREALQRVRDEMGEDAVILSNRKVGENVEIVALDGEEYAKMTQEPKKAPASRPAQRTLTQRTQARRSPAELAPLPAIQHNPSYGRPAAPRADEPATYAMPAPAAAAPAPAPAPAPAAAAEQEGILNEIKSMRDMMQEQIACLSWSGLQTRDPKRAQMLRTLLNIGFSPVLSRQLLEKMPEQADLAWVRQILANNLRVATQEEDVVVKGGVYALVGPTGVGKTTTTAKLAARAVVRHGADRVALITTDSYRIGAHEQLRIYGKILGVEVHAVRDTEDLRLTLSALKKRHLVLIDTMGLGQRDARVAEQTEMLDATGVQRLLLLNATSCGDTLEDVVHKYHGTGVIGCIPTKLDEAATLGTVLDVIVRHKLALHYIASGQRVPEDLHEVNLEYLLHRTFKSVVKAAPFTMRELEFPVVMAGLGATPAPQGEAYAV